MSSRYKIKLCLVMTLLFSLGGLFAQKLSMDIHMPQGIQYQDEWGYFQGGFGLSLHYLIPNENVIYKVGMNARTIQWGTQTSISMEIAWPFRDRYDIGIELQNGLALFYEKPLYVYSIGITGRIAVINKSDFRSGISLGGKFTHCPAYGHYGNINHILEIPLGLYVNF